MKNHIELPKKGEIYKNLTEAMTGHESFKMKFIHNIDSCDCFVNDALLIKIDKNQVAPLLKNIFELAVSFDMKPEMTFEKKLT